MGNPLLPKGGSPARGGASSNPLIKGASSGKGVVTKDDLKRRKQNALSRLASIPGEAVKDIAGASKSSLVRILDTLDRPVQGIKGLAFGKGPGESLSEAWKGLSGKRRFSIEQALTQDEDAKLKGIGGFAANFAGDVLLDPLTYATLGTSAVAKVGLKNVGKALGAETAEAVSKGGLKAAGVSREAAKDALRPLVADEKILARQIKALEKGATGGVKVGGRTIIKGSSLGKTGRAITEARPAAATLKLIGKSPVGSVGRGLRSAFITHAGVKDAVGKEAGTQFGELGRMADAQASNATEDSVVRMAAAGRKVKGADRTAVTDALHDPSLVPTLSDKARKLYEAVDAERAALTASQLASGVLPEGIRNTKSYFARVMTPEGQKILGTLEGRELATRLFKAPNVESLGLDMKQGFRHARRFMPDAHVREVNEALVAKFKGAGIDVKDGTKFFDEDPIAAFGKRAEAAHRATARSDFATKLGSVKTDKGAPLVVRSGRGTPAERAEILAEITELRKEIQKAQVAKAKATGGLVESRKAGGDVLRRLGHAQGKVGADEALEANKARLKELRDAGKRQTDAEVKAALPENVRADYVVTTFNGERLAVHHSVKKDLEAMEELLSSDEALKGLAQSMNRVNALWKGIATVLPVSGGFFSRNAHTNIFAAWLKGLKNPIRYEQAWKMQRAAMQGRRAGEIGGKLTGKDRELWDLARKWGVLEGGMQIQDVGNTVLDANLGKAGTLTQKAKSLAPIRAGRKINSAVENNARLALFIDQMAKHGDPEQAARTVKEALFDYGDLTPVERKVFRNVMGFYTFARKNVALQAKELARQPGKAAAIEHFRQALVGAAEGELPEDTEVPAYLQEAGGFLLPRGVANVLSPGSEGPTFLQPDIGPTAAAQTLNPFIKAAQALIPGGEHMDTTKIARELLNVPSGPIPAAVQALSERATGKDSFTGAPSSDSLQKALLEGLVPGIRKTAKAQKDIGDRNLASFLGGIRATDVTDAKERAELYRQLDALARRIAEIKRSGKDVPTVNDLKGSGGGSNPLLG